MGWSRLKFSCSVFSLLDILFPDIRVGLQSREARKRKLVESISFVHFFSLIYLLGEENSDPSSAILRHTRLL